MGNLTAKKPRADEIRNLTLRDMIAPLFRKKRVVVAAFFAIFAVALCFGLSSVASAQNAPAPAPADQTAAAPAPAAK